VCGRAAGLATRPPVRVVAEGEAATTLASVEHLLVWFADA